MAQTKITLFFSTRPTRELLEIRFSSASTDGELTSVRGTFSGARGDASTFKWTPATQALSVILLRAAADGRDPTLQDVISRPLLFGRFGSHANQLSRGIYKNARWILDDFVCGVTRDGRKTFERKVNRSQVIGVLTGYPGAKVALEVGSGAHCSLYRGYSIQTEVFI